MVEISAADINVSGASASFIQAFLRAYIVFIICKAIAGIILAIAILQILRAGRLFGQQNLSDSLGCYVLARHILVYSLIVHVVSTAIIIAFLGNSITLLSAYSLILLVLVVVYALLFVLLSVRLRGVKQAMKHQASSPKEPPSDPHETSAPTTPVRPATGSVHLKRVIPPGTTPPPSHRPA